MSYRFAILLLATIELTAMFSADLPSGKRKPPRIRGGPKRRVVLINLLAVLSQRFDLRRRRTACRRLSLVESGADLRPAERECGAPENLKRRKRIFQAHCAPDEPW